MARASVPVLLWFLVFVGLLSISWARVLVDEPGHGEKEWERRRGQSGEEETGQPQIKLGEAREVLQSDGGRLRVWSEEIDALRNTHVGIVELQLEQDGLLVPQYADADQIGYVLQGQGRMGAVVPGAQSEFRRTFVREVEKGDVIALPKGTVYWWYNGGKESQRVIFAGDTSFGANPGRFNQFGLAGNKKARFGSVLHGFSHEMLATAWGVDQESIKTLLSRQNAAGIVRAQQKIQFPEMPYIERRRQGEEQDNALDFYSGRRSAARGSYFEELKYSIRSEQPDFFVENGGWLNIVNDNKLPALRQVGFSAVKVSLEKNAMAAPSFTGNAHQLIYITRGNGRVQVASGDGENAFDEEVGEGTVLAIPQFFPSLQIAGDQGMEWINLLTSDRPFSSFLAGRNSVYRGVPKQVFAAAFNVDQKTLQDLGREEEMIFPAQKEGQGKHSDMATTKREEQEEEEQRRRREEEEEQRRREEEEEKERREREEEEKREHEREEEEKRHDEEEERRRREEEAEKRREHDKLAVPAWALASLQLLK